jgi:class 3 adenylate cyclase
MNQRDEYIGRAINVAARLQGAIKQKDRTPAGKLLISKNSYASLGLSKTPKYAGKLVDRLLANVAGGEHYQVRKIIISK